MAIGALDFLEDGLEALFELAAELGTGDQGAHVERDDAAILEAFGDVAAHDALGETFDDGRLADAGLADQDGVVLGAAREDLDDAANFFVAADDGVEFAFAGGGGEVAAILLERFVGRFGILRGDALGAAEFVDGGGKAVAGLADEFAGEAVVVLQGEQEVLDGEIVVLHLLRFLLGVGEEFGEAGGDVDLVGRAAGGADLGELFELLLQTAANLLWVEARLAEDVGGETLVLGEQGVQ